jgi:hypothetical protein
MGGDENSGGDLTAFILDKLCFSVKKRAEPSEERHTADAPVL